MPMVELSEDEFVEIYRIRQLLEPEKDQNTGFGIALHPGRFAARLLLWKL